MPIADRISEQLKNATSRSPEWQAKSRRVAIRWISVYVRLLSSFKACSFTARAAAKGSEPPAEALRRWLVYQKVAIRSSHTVPARRLPHNVDRYTPTAPIVHDLGVLKSRRAANLLIPSVGSRLAT